METVNLEELEVNVKLAYTGHDYCPMCNRIGATYIEDSYQGIRIWTCSVCGTIPQNL